MRSELAKCGDVYEQYGEAERDLFVARQTLHGRRLFFDDLSAEVADAQQRFNAARNRYVVACHRLDVVVRRHFPE